MLRYKTKVSEREQEFLNAVRYVAYGEIFSPRLEPGPLDQPAELTANELDLLKLMRGGVEISILTVYQGQPAHAEVDEIKMGFRCRKKVKFPTV